MDVGAMLDRDGEAWDDLVKLLDRHPVGVVHSPTSEWPWTSRDVFCHLARWMNFSTDGMVSVLAGEPLPVRPPGTDDEINRRWRSEDSGVSFDEARRCAIDAFDRRVRVVRSIAVDRWDAQLEQLAHFDGADHIREHLSYLVVG